MVEFKYKMNLDFDILRAISKEDLQLAGNELAYQVVQNTLKGVSSVSGGGANPRFPAYKDPKKYPGEGQSRLKNQRPVNLLLTGDMLDSMDVKVIKKQNESGFKIEIQDKKYLTHHLGLNGVPQRKVIPILKGEKLSQSIQLLLNKLSNDLVKKAVARLNKGSR